MDRFRVVIHESYCHQWAGAQKTGVSIAAGLDRDRFDPVLVTTGESVLARKARELGVRVRVHVPPPPLNEFNRRLLEKSSLEKAGILLRRVLGYNLGFRRVLQEEKADLLVCNTSRSTLLLPFMRRIGPCPVVTYLQGAIDLGSTVRRMVRWASDFFIAVSEDIPPVYGLPASKFTVVPNGIPPEFAEGPFPSPGVRKPPGKKWLVAVGNVVPYKGHFELLRAFSAIAPGNPDWELAVVGSMETDAGWAKRLREEAERSGIAGRVHWVGWVEDVRPYLASADLFVMPSHVEGHPYCLMEALAFGLPVVATDVSGVRMLLGGNGEGIVVLPRDEGALASGILEAIAMQRANPRFGLANADRIKSSFTRRAMCEKAGMAFLSVIRAGGSRKDPPGRSASRGMR